MERTRKYFTGWNAARIIRIVLACSLFTAYYYNREFIFIFAGIILTVQAVFNISCPGGSCSVAHGSEETQKLKFKKNEPEK